MTIETESNAVNEEAQVVESGLFNAESKSSSDILTRARKSKKLSVEEVASELNLSTSVVRAIESDNWEALPEATYVRGYVRSYANLLGLDVEEVLINFRYKNSEADLNLDAMPKGLNEPGVTSNIPKGVKWLVILGGIGIGAYSLFGDGIKNFIETQRLGLTKVEVAQTSIDTEVKTIAPVAAKAVVVGAEAESEKVEVLESPVAAEVKEMLELSFSGISWVDISDSSDRKVIYKSFPPGETVKVKAKKPLKVFIGNVAAVKMTYQGEEIKLADFQEEDHAKFTLED